MQDFFHQQYLSRCVSKLDDDLPPKKKEKHKVYTPENWHVSPKDPQNEKENHLNQTSMNLCSMMFHLKFPCWSWCFLCFFCWRDGQEMDKVELDVDTAKSMQILISRLRLGLPPSCFRILCWYMLLRCQLIISVLDRVSKSCKQKSFRISRFWNTKIQFLVKRVKQRCLTLYL